MLLKVNIKISDGIKPHQIPKFSWYYSQIEIGTHEAKMIFCTRNHFRIQIFRKIKLLLILTSCKTNNDINYFSLVIVKNDAYCCAVQSDCGIVSTCFSKLNNILGMSYLFNICHKSFKFMSIGNTWMKFLGC